MPIYPPPGDPTGTAAAAVAAAGTSVAAFGHSGTNLFSPLTLWLHNTLEGWVGSSYNGANGGLPFIVPWAGTIYRIVCRAAREVGNPTTSFSAILQVNEVDVNSLVVLSSTGPPVTVASDVAIAVTAGQRLRSRIIIAAAGLTAPSHLIYLRKAA